MGTTESILYDASPQQDQRVQGNDAVNLSQGRSSASSSGSATRRQLRRSRPVNVTTLKGVVLGLTNSGKRTLLRRLEGKDPFVDANDDPPLAITVPYQPPPNTTVWDRIQLQVQVKPEPCDFCVILVNPKHDPKSLRPYIAKIVTMLVQQAGYAQKTPPRPLCLCILLNFRDLRGDRYDRIQRKDVEEWVNEIMEQHSVVREKVVLQCGTTSLRNCYGLSSLHHFIYRSYLQHKKVEWEQRLENIRTELDKSREVPSMTYDAFLKVLEQTETDTNKPADDSSDKPSVGPRKKIFEKEARKRDERKDRHIEEVTKQSVLDGRQRVERKEKGPTRSVMPNEYVDPKQALEAFFADDDDEDVTPKTSHHVRNALDSDDDDDDDFFYDEKGQRHQHGGVDSSSDEEESIESHDAISTGSLAKARGLSVVDEESSTDVTPLSLNDKATTKAVKLTDKVGVTDTADEDNEMDMDNDDENGWGDDDVDDDDIDLVDEGNDDYERKYGENELKDYQRVTLDTEEHTKKGETDAIGSNNRDGWKDDDLDLSETDKTPVEDLSTDYESPIPESDEVNKTGTGDKDTPDRLKDPSTDETELSKSSYDDEHAAIQSSLVASEAIATDAVSRSNDTEAVQEKEALVAKPANATVSAKCVASNESHDDDFIVEEALPKSSLPKQSSDMEPPIPLEEAPSISSSTLSLSTPGISAAALAAITAAEREAELMVQEAMNAPPLKPAKKSKKKKDLETKKAKKKKKEKRKDSD